MSTFLNRKFYTTIFIIITFVNIISVLNKSSSLEKYPEITDDELVMFQIKFREETDANEKKYLEPVVRPDKFDLNKDKKISKQELRKALEYVLYPKDSRQRVKIDSILDKHVQSNIDLFVKTIDINYLTLGQFAKIMIHISPTNFINDQVLRGKAEARARQVEESEQDL
jgi:hypothetical protein